MEKQTAVETLVDNLIKLGYLHSKEYGQSPKVTEVIKQALAMEEDQIMNAWVSGVISEDDMTSKKYYKETYEKS
jgi:hypothetical protein